MNEIDCHIVADLMPLYLEGLTSDETNRMIEDHLQSCPNCKRRLEELRRPILKRETSDSEIEKKIAKRLYKMGWLQVLKFAVLFILTSLCVMSFICFSQNFILKKYAPLLVVGALGYWMFRKWIQPFLAIVLAAVTGIILDAFLFHTSVLPFLVTIPAVLLFAFSGFFIAAGIVNMIKKTHFPKSGLVALLILIITLALSVSGIADLGTAWLEAALYTHTHDLRLTSVEFCGPMDGYGFGAVDHDGTQQGYLIDFYTVTPTNGG